jgi:amino acid transporter
LSRIAQDKRLACAPLRGGNPGPCWKPFSLSAKTAPGQAETLGDQMTDRPVTAFQGPAHSPATAGGLKPEAIGLGQDTIIGMATSAPAGTVAATLAALAAASAYAGGLVLLITAVPMLVIANAYRRLNLWNANCGTSFEWVGRSMNPYLGFLTGWVMILGYVLTTVAEVVVLAPSVLAIWGSSSTNTWQAIGVDVALVLIMLIIAVVGIRLTARVQVGMALVEYTVLIGLSIAGLVIVLAGHHPGAMHITSGWFSISGVGHGGSLAAGLLISVYIYSGWDASVYVNEETRRRMISPGQAVMLATALLAVIYILAQVGLQGVVSPKALQAHVSTAMIYAAQAIGGGAWGKVMALAIALSVIGATGTGIVITARLVYGMSSRDVLPRSLSNVSPRWRTPVLASVLAGAAIIAAIVVDLKFAGLSNIFSDVVGVSGLLFTIFYVMTGLAMMVYYRSRITASVIDFLTLGLLPTASIVLLGWVFAKTIVGVPLGEVYTIYSVVGSGIAVMILVRLLRNPAFFHVRREKYPRSRQAPHGSAHT